MEKNTLEDLFRTMKATLTLSNAASLTIGVDYEGTRVSITMFHQDSQDNL